MPTILIQTTQMKTIWTSFRHKFCRYLLHILFPNRCPGCDVIIDPYEYVCTDCGERMLIEHDAICHRCGKVACQCKVRTFSYDHALAACQYADETVPAIIRLKRTKNTNFAYFSARILAGRLRHSPLYTGCDCVMSVPMHRAKKRQLGYNQAALIARELARLLDVPYREDVLYKEKSRHAQHELSAAERTWNVSCFKAHDISLDGQHILLCDDVLTTGSTLNRCAALLKQQGAVHVTVAAAATTIPRNHRGISPLSPPKEELL
ncbi:MAG: double zinc ribbon domain-containing protein [Oscillospiraceae bacterium]|nr:double zinc ribbon domain-containing protein [Oscillospiraceae bacterium]